MDEPLQSELGAAHSLPSPSEVHVPLASPGAGQRFWLASPIDKETLRGQQVVSGSHAKFADEAHVYLREYIRNADQKATFFFATLTAILAFLNSQNTPARWLKDVRSWSFVDFLGFLSMFGLAAGAITLLAVVFPRLRGSRRGILFFGAIAECDSSGHYVADVLARSGDDLVLAKLEHCHELSKVCCAKYRTLRAGFWIGCIGVASSLLFLLLAKSIAA